MKHFLYIIFVFLCCFCSGTSAQSLTARNSVVNRLFGFKNAKFEKKQQNKQTRQGVKKIPIIKHNTNSGIDTVSYALYMNSVKQYGWMRGLGEPITEEHAKHLSSYLRFSHKNKAGHWTKVENLNGYGKLENNSMATYLVNPFDDNDEQIDPSWKDKLLSIVSWELVGDISGENCIQENAYDKEGNLVYSYIPVQVGKDTYMGHYVDAWGVPAKFRDEKEAKYVVVKWDEYGYESEVSFIGDDGFPKKNNWGAYIAKYEYDKDGFIQSNMSCAADGSYMKDRFGNCGQKTIHDKYGNSLISTNYDEHSKIMRVPIGKSSNSDYVQQRFKYDKYGRSIENTCYLEDGTPDTTQYGVHGWEVKYNAHGQMIYIRNFDINRKSKNHISGHCSIRREYDERGNETFFELRDEKGAFVNNSSLYCLDISKFDNDICIEDRQYKTTNGRDTILIYHFYKVDNKKVWQYPEGDLQEVTVYDNFGNEIEDSYYTMDGNPTISYQGFHKKRNILSYSTKKCTNETLYLDINHNLVNINNEEFKKYMVNNNSYVYNHCIEFTDTLNFLRRITYLDGCKILKQFEQPRSTDFNFPLGEIAVDIVGEKARSQYEQALYYNCYTGRSIKDGIAYLGGTNEYGEPAYILENDGINSKTYVIRSNGIDFDEYGNQIINNKELRDSLSQAFVIEIIDTLAFKKWGIKSGDVIMKYGEWNYPIPNSEFVSKQKLFRTLFAQKDIEKVLIIMRRNPSTNEAEYKVINLEQGLPQDFGFIIHRILYTQKEKKRYMNCYQKIDKKYLKTDNPKKKFAKNGKNMLFMQSCKIDGYKRNIFGKGIKGDAFVLGLVVQNQNGEFSMLGYEELKNKFDSCRFSDSRIYQKIWFTTDLENVQTLELEGNGTYWDSNFWYVNCDKRISNSCHRLYKITQHEMNEYVNQGIKKLQESRMEKYGDAYNAIVNDSIYLVLGETVGDKGYMIENGYKGQYVVLDWCGWKCTDNISRYKEVFNKFKKKKKVVTLLPFYSENNRDRFEDIITVKSKNKILGLSLKTVKVSYPYFKNVILSRYNSIDNKQIIDNGG